MGTTRAIAELDRLSDEKLLRHQAKRGLSDFYYFCTEILHINALSSFPRPEREHRPFIEWLGKPRPQRLGRRIHRRRYYSVSRGVGKTTNLAAYCGWRICQNPNVQIRYESEQKALASTVVQQVEDWLQSEDITRLYGHFKGKSGWSLDKFKVLGRRSGLKDPTMTAGGIDVALQGWHPNLVIADDLQGDTNTTPDGISKVKRRLEQFWHILNPGGELIWTCTRWDFADAAAQILDQLRDDPKSWDHPGSRGFFGAYAVEGDEKVFPDAVPGEVLFSATLPEDVLADKRSTMTPSSFASQLLNSPIPEEGSTFDSRDFQWVPEYDPEDPLFQGLAFYMAVDTATGMAQTRRGNATTIHVIGVKGQGRHKKIFVVESKGSHLWKPKKTMDQVFLIAEKWRPRTIAVETGGPQKHFYNRLIEERRSREIHIPLREFERIGRHAESKEDFIANTLEPLYRSRQVFHCKDLKNGKLEMELCRFQPGSASHPDYSDSLAIAVTVGKASPSERGQKHSGEKKTPYRPLYEGLY